MDRPTILPTWADSISAQISTPDGGKQEIGFLPNAQEEAANTQLNWLHHYAGEWLLFFRDEHLDGSSIGHQAAQIEMQSAGLNPTRDLQSALADLSQRTTVLVLAEQNDPPAEPEDGDMYLIGSAPTGAWDGDAGMIARWEDHGGSGTWFIYQPGPSWLLVPDGGGFRVLFSDGANNWTELALPGGPSEVFSEDVISVATDTVLTNARRFVLAQAQPAADTTITLEDAALATHSINVKHVLDGPAFNVVVAAAVGQTVEGGASIIVPAGQSRTLVSDGVSAWWIV